MRVYRVADWTPDAGGEDEWLAPWAESGWTLEYPDDGGAWCVVNGHHVKRFSLVHDDT